MAAIRRLQEKSEVTTVEAPRASLAQSWPWRFLLMLVFVMALAVTNSHGKAFFLSQGGLTERRSQCPAQLTIAPTTHPELTKKNVEQLFQSEDFKKLSIERLAGATKIPTVDYDDMGPIAEDARWDIFYDLAKYFQDTFPLLHRKLELARVNTHGLVYTWHGSDRSLQPILLTGHTDVVPIANDTLSEWKHHPFSGYFDGTYINGRGAHDCKNNIIGIFSAITALLESDFQPRRTVVLGFGFDEESPQNKFGAYQIAQHLEAKWGRNAFAILVDEGGIGIVNMYGRTFGIPQSSEKGYLDLVIRVHVPGGHSSIPPAHTSIGILSEVVTALEETAGKNFPSKFTNANPFFYQLQCAAEDTSSNLSAAVRSAVLYAENDSGKRVTELLKNDYGSDILLRTSQAVTIFHAGNKANALPAFAEALVNYRISNEEALSDVQAAILSTVLPLALKHGLQLIQRSESDESTTELPQYAMSLSWWRNLEPSPVSTHKSDAWKYFSGVIKHVFDEEGEGKDVVVAPTISEGNTDTKYFWDLSPQIYRFGPLRIWHDEGWGGIHDVNERISLDAHMESILFYHEFIRVFDEVRLDVDGE